MSLNRKIQAAQLISRYSYVRSEASSTSSLLTRGRVCAVAFPSVGGTPGLRNPAGCAAAGGEYQHAHNSFLVLSCLSFAFSFWRPGDASKTGLELLTLSCTSQVLGYRYDLPGWIASFFLDNLETMTVH